MNGKIALRKLLTGNRVTGLRNLSGKPGEGNRNESRRKIMYNR
jgi:hypothetical protein